MTRRPRNRVPPQRGTTLVEFVVGPLVLFILLVLMQYALLFHAKSQVNYATFEAVRAGTVSNAQLPAMRTAFNRAMTGYHGGGTTTAELATAHARALAESPFVRIEILSNHLMDRGRVTVSPSHHHLPASTCHSP